MFETMTREQLLQLSKEELVDIIFLLVKDVHALRQRVTELEAKLKIPPASSSNSSKPPSQDFKPNAPTKALPKKKGPPKGHPQHPKPFRENPDVIHEYTLDACPDCQHPLSSQSKQWIRHQWLELRELKIDVHEDLRQFTTCACCRKTVYAPMEQPSPSYVGPRLQTFIGMLHYHGGVSQKKLQDLLSFYSPVSLSTGTIDRVLESCSKGLEPFYTALGKTVSQSSFLGADETLWRVGGEKRWAWVFNNRHCTYYAIRPTRGTKELEEILGLDYAGGLLTDFYRAYDPLKFATAYKCNAHLLRDLKRGMEEEHLWGEQDGFCESMINLMHTGFWLKSLKTAVWKYNIDEEELYKRFESSVSNQLSRTDIRAKSIGSRLQARILKYRDAIFRFIQDEHAPPTNNCSEQAIRKLVIHRKRSNGSRSEAGALRMSRFLSFLETAKKQGWDLVSCLENLFSGGAPLPVLQGG